MDKIGIEYSFLKDSKDKCLSVKVLDESWKGINTSYLLAEVGESVLHSSVAIICYDFTSLKFVSSSCLGAILNLSEKAKIAGKTVNFKFSDEVMETIHTSGVDKVIHIENSRG